MDINRDRQEIILLDNSITYKKKKSITKGAYPSLHKAEKPLNGTVAQS